MGMDLYVSATGLARWGDDVFRCAIGKSGFIDPTQKKEGDGATPVGIFPLRRVLYRADRVTLPPTKMDSYAYDQQDAWCEAPDHPDYNRLVKTPHPGVRHVLWRDGDTRDVIIPIGYNDNPAVAGKGSAIFIHPPSDDYAPSEGCVTIAVSDMLKIIASGTSQSRIILDPVLVIDPQK